MSVYTDTIHMVATTENELHEFAHRIGLPRHRFEGILKGHPHYDLYSTLLGKAMKEGAVVVTSREIVRLSKAMVMNPRRGRWAYKRP